MRVFTAVSKPGFEGGRALSAKECVADSRGRLWLVELTVPVPQSGWQGFVSEPVDTLACSASVFDGECE
jgi:hypothetical protein